jgi:DNA-binding LytR/AlgR family response regulator
MSLKKTSGIAPSGACSISGGSQMLRIIICDDDAIMLEKMAAIVDAVFLNFEPKIKVHTYSDVEQISEPLLSSCDIALLDIDYENQSCNGMDIARKLRKLRKDAIIIFVTNFIEYAPEGYEVQAFRYVLKRQMEQELTQALKLAYNQLLERNETFKIQVNGEIIDLSVKETVYLEVQQHNVTAYIQKDTSGRTLKPYSFYASLSHLEERLAPLGFLRIHKSYLVNMRYIKKFQCRQAELEGGQILRVSEKSYAEKKKEYLLWKGWQ